MKCPDIWIGDTEAFKHSMISNVGGINKQEYNIKTLGQMGIATSPLVLLDFKVKLCNVHGKCYGKAVLKDIQVSSSFNYNLFSFNWLLKDDFTQSGNNTTLAIVCTSNKWSMVFDVKIHTNSSFLLAGYMQ